MLELININKTFYTEICEITALEDINLTVNSGEFIAIVGSSGCGKSTLLNIIAGLEKKTGGTINIKNNIVIGYMLQEDALFPWLNILDNTLLGLKIKGLCSSKNIAYVHELLDKYGLKNFKDKFPKELSGGMRQRVALIRTLATKPDLLLLDEPFSALDYQTRLAVSNDVFNIIKNEQKTTIMVTHDLAEAISLADRIVVLTKRPGKVKTIHDIILTNKSTPIHNRSAKEFASYYERIWKELDINV